MSTAINEYDLGDLVRCSGPFTTTAGAAMDPAAVYFKAKDPEGAVIGPYQYGVDAQLVKDSVGNYHVDLDANKTGTWTYKFYSTGNGQAADERSFTVARSAF